MKKKGNSDLLMGGFWVRPLLMVSLALNVGLITKSGIIFQHPDFKHNNNSTSTSSAGLICLEEEITSTSNLLNNPPCSLKEAEANTRAQYSSSSSSSSSPTDIDILINLDQ